MFTILTLLIASNLMAQDLSVWKQELVGQEQKLRQAYVTKTQKTLSPKLLPHLLESSLSQAQKEIVLDWYKKEKAFQSQYDNLQNKKLDYFGDLVLKQGSCYQKVVTSSKKTSTKEKNKIALKRNELERMDNVYRANRQLFGSKDDYLRVIAYRDFSTQALSFVEHLEKAVGISQHKLITRIDKLVEGLISLPHLVKVKRSMKKDRQSGQGETPIIDAIGEGVRALGRKWDVNVTWQGLENMPKPVYDGSTLNIIAFEHANALLDTVAQAEIPSQFRQGIGFFGVAKYVFPEDWVKALDASDHYIVVNQGKEIPRTLEIIGSRKLHGFFAAGEGLTPAGVYESRPISPLFTNTYWELKQLGLKVNLVPMSYPKNFRLYNAWIPSKDTQKDVIGVVGEALSSRAADTLKEITQDPNSIGIWIRSMWHESFITDSEKLLSAPRIEKIQEELEEKLWGDLEEKLKTNCL